MRDPDMEVYVVIAHKEGEDPNVLGVFSVDGHAERLQNIIADADPERTIDVVQAEYWGSE